MVAAGGALTAWAFAAHYQAAPRGWALESRPTPGYLLRTGPYRWSRNPMYAGEAAVWLGWALFYASPAVWAGLVIVSAAFTTLVPWEERWLLERFGADYQAYLADVPRWVPRAPRRPRPADRRRFRAARDRNHQGGGGERALPLIMTWRADKRAGNTPVWAGRPRGCERIAGPVSS